METKHERNLRFATSERVGALIDKRSNGELDQELMDGIEQLKAKGIKLQSYFVAGGIYLSGKERGVTYTHDEINELLEMYGLDLMEE